VSSAGNGARDFEVLEERCGASDSLECFDRFEWFIVSKYETLPAMHLLNEIIYCDMSPMLR